MFDLKAGSWELNKMANSPECRKIKNGLKKALLEVKKTYAKLRHEALMKRRDARGASARDIQETDNAE